MMSRDDKEPSTYSICEGDEEDADVQGTVYSVVRTHHCRRHHNRRLRCPRHYCSFCCYRPRPHNRHCPGLSQLM